jgi:hypothetical protein
VCEPARRQSPHSTVAARGSGRLEEGGAKPVRGKAGQEGGCVKTMPGQSSTGSAEEAKQGAEMGRNWAWIEAGVWTERMLSALGNGVKGGKRPLRECRAVRASHRLAISETVSMKKPPTGEPYAGKPPVRFGGRGRRKPIPTPIRGSDPGLLDSGFRLRRPRNDGDVGSHRFEFGPKCARKPPTD